MKKIIKLFIWLVIFFGIIFYINYSKITNFEIKENITIKINQGDSIINGLSRELGLSQIYLKIYLKLNPEKKINLQAGEYRLLAGENINSIIKTINYGSITIDEKITILEGWNIYDIDEYLTNLGFINKNEFVSESLNIDKYKNNFPFLEKALTLEGFLYPDTYFINKNDFNIEKLNKLMLENFKKRIYNNLLSTLSKKQIVEVINLASIVEKEEKNKDQRPTVAGILKKRYVENWMIGADITACYAYKLTANECKLNLSKYIGEKNDYNTRTMVGLPKTPIGNPSFDSVNSVINSKNTPYYYYLHDITTGKIYYAKTNSEHVKNKKYLK